MSREISYRLDLPPDFSNYEWEVEKKGWFGNVCLFFEDNQYQLNFYDPYRLKQEIEDEINTGVCFFEKNLIVVQTVNSVHMHRAITDLIITGQISQLKKIYPAPRNRDGA